MSSLWQVLSGCLLVLPLASWSQASHNIIVDSHGFEAPDYTVNPSPSLEGQQGWVTAGNGGGTARIQKAVVESGTQAVRVDRASNSDDRWAVPVGGLGHPTNRYIIVDWDMNVLDTASDVALGPFFGVDTYDDSSGDPNVLAALGVDATTGDVLYQKEDTGFLVATGTTVAHDSWNHFQIRLDFLEDTFTALVNGAEVASERFVDGPTNMFTDADIATFAASFDAASQMEEGEAYFDNFLVRNIDRSDLNLDGWVDGLDLGILLSNWGDDVDPDSNMGELKGGAPVDGLDLGVLLSEWHPEPAGVGGASAVPEPTTLALAGLAAIACCSRRRRS